MREIDVDVVRLGESESVVQKLNRTLNKQIVAGAAGDIRKQGREAQYWVSIAVRRQLRRALFHDVKHDHHV
jgi:hypothetical protein